MASKQTSQSVDLFYLGGLNDKDGVQYVTSGGDVLTVPPVGESFRIPMYVAQDLIKRYNVKGNQFFSFSKNPMDAITDQTRQKVLGTMSREDLLAALANLPGETPVVKADPAVDPTVLNPAAAIANEQARPDVVRDNVTEYLQKMAEDFTGEEAVKLDEPDAEPDAEPAVEPVADTEPEAPAQPAGKGKSKSAKAPDTK